MKRFFRPYSFLLASAFSVVLACQPYIQRDSEPLPTVLEEVIPYEDEKETLGVPSPDVFQAEKISLIYHLNPYSDAEQVLNVFEANPSLRVSLIFPEKFFESEERKALENRFEVLVASNQIEPVLNLEDKPNLAIISSFSDLEPETRRWDFDIRWEEDALAHVALGMAEFKKSWKVLPSGFIPPYFALTPNLMKALGRFRIDWALGQYADQAGIKYYGKTVLLIPPKTPELESAPQGSDKWSALWAGWVLGQEFSYVDGSRWDNPRSEINFLQALSNRLQENRFALSLVKERVQSGLEETIELKNVDPFPTDYSEWARTAKQQQAWKAISEAREIYEKYKNSGRASLRRLNAAQEELLSAQSGPFLLALGQTVTPLTLNEQNFIATLSNVYRLCGAPIPPDINLVFSKRTGNYQRATSKQEGPFFEKEDSKLTWNDPSRDDDGPGSYVYPLGPYKSGVFDILKVQIYWSGSQARVTIYLRGKIQLEKTPSLPLVDLYLDVNRVPNAGSSAALPNRGKVRIDRNAGWEYAISAGPLAGALFQSIPGSAPRKIFDLKPSFQDGNTYFSFSLPLNLVRGNPQDWRISLGLGASEQLNNSQTLTPLPVNPDPSEKAFGGGLSGRTPPVYVDILAPSHSAQKEALNPYEQGREGALPFVEDEE